MSQVKEKNKKIITKEQELEQEKKEKYYELRQLNENIKELHEHIERMEEQITELKANKVILKKFSELKPGKELRVPLASGIYIIAELKDTSKVMINVGSDITVEKKPEEVIEILETQVKELVDYRKTLVEKIKSMIERAEELQSYLQE
ncbi:MAG: prefoldin subunit alpha [Candidatus Woesearchaeota archaeon]